MELERKQTLERHGFSYPLKRDMVKAYSRYFHRNTPENKYFREKIPWKTILIAFLFLIMGTGLLIWGISDAMEKPFSECYEKILLGAILFIPGSYHSFLACMALRGVDGYDYEHLTVFENEDFF